MAYQLFTEPTHQPKASKSLAFRYAHFVMHLAPADLSGHNVCASSTPGCRAACLNTAGRGAMDQAQTARIRRTRWYFADRRAFMAQLIKEIHAAQRYADKRDLSLAIRLNGTSDIRWESVRVGGYANIMAMFPTVQFYDYTKHANRRNIPRNYHLTYSRGETVRSMRGVAEALRNGLSVAVVFDTPKHAALPATWHGNRVIDGREHDSRFLDPAGVIVGLSALGRGKRDSSGFVVAA